MNIIDRNREEIQTNGKKKNGDYSVLRDRVRDLLPSSYLQPFASSCPNLLLIVGVSIGRCGDSVRS